MVTRSDKPPPFALRILGIALLAGSGAVVGAAVTHLVLNQDMPWEDGVALTAAGALVAMAIAGGVIMAMRPSSVPKGCGLLQIVVLILAAAMFVLPIYGGSWLGADTVFALVLGLMVAQTAANVMLWNRADEMLRRIMAETAAMAFVACQGGLFVYAAAERLGLVGAVSTWGLIGIVMWVYLLASSLAAARRGIH